MDENTQNHTAVNGEPVPNPAGDRVIVLVGLMGAGKTTVGRRLANRLDIPFVDADAEIEAAAGMTIPEIFAQHGEQHFREGERKVIARLLQQNGGVLATGGGAFMDPETRAQIKRDGVSVWLRADVGLLLKRVARRNNRPLLKQGDPAEIMTRLRDERYPVYAQADITVDSTDAPHEEIVDAIITALQGYFSDPHHQADR
ncbi:MAG TPA: shikimate kinase [Alphaproteobacteria bacterium]|jgi:shikimate kinase|nr:shikimate kinase [Alphaproteobacteria bacterium]HBA42180.1 shikimate kinase [Alphaproteobacteria bacterium]HBC55478.1 shikimate kinase [Alphaproteobacteria bacterium]HCO89430.1 shikimate kinase [Alphaproteobacteria bacterium]